MRAEISRLQRRLGITTVYVTHDQTEAMTLGDRVAVLRKGLLQQVASPRELYEQPVNLFVAGFIGAPPMNLLPATVENGQVSLPFCTVPVPSGVNASEVEGKLLVAGVRPEFFNDAAYVDAAKRDRGQTFTATVDVTEWLGNEQYAYVPYDLPQVRVEGLEEIEDDLGGETLQPQLVVALDPASNISDGTTAKIWFDPSRLHVFDMTSGENLALAVPAST
jgi:multiple sugar transport system ATP-binding protein